MAGADVEADFVGSGLAINGVKGSEQAPDAASDHQTDSSSDEYDPLQALQYFVPNRSSSVDISTHAPPSNLSTVPVTDQTFHNTYTPKAESQSRSMSRASSSSTEGRPEPPVIADKGRPSDRTQAKNGDVEQSEVDGGRDIDRDVKASVSHSISNSPIHNLSPKDVSIQKDVQDHSSFNAVENGVAHSVPDLAVLLSEVKALPRIDVAANTSLPVSQVKDLVSSTTEPTVTPNTAAPRARLPHDRIGILEDRIKEDPRGALDAWLNLIGEHRKRGKIEDARSAYERFLHGFPSAAEQWVAYAQMENEAQNRMALEKIFQRTLLQIPHVQLWSMYLDHIRRHNNVTTDTSGEARQIIHQAYDLALQNVGLDKDSGKFWQDYVQFIKSGPGNIGGSNWQDQQKMDLLRKTYQRAICVPTQSTNMLWKEYDGFEMGLNKITGRKFLQDQSPSYMSARSSYIELQNITRRLRRTTLPVLPPAPGCDGEVDYMEQLEIWQRWIKWEIDDPLVLKQDDIAAYRDRTVFAYKQALMAMRFWPEMWCDAADFCFNNNLDAEGNEFLVQGIAANPESCLLAFKRADRLELTTANEEGDESAKRRGASVREPYDKVLDALYDLIAKAKAREAQEISRVEAQFAIDDIERRNGIQGDDPDDDAYGDDEDSKEKRKSAQVESVKAAHAVQVGLLSTTVSHVWIALMRAMRRIQGKGKVNEQIGGSRQIFTDARKRGRITSDVYVASALIEFHCYDPETTKKIFERGLKLFPQDEAFALEYIKHLIANNDHTNARVVFETAVHKLAQKPETLSKTKPLYAFIHEFESRYGELVQINKLEKRMRDLFPEDPLLRLFSQRFTNQGFDPTAVRPIISPDTQTRPRTSLNDHTPPTHHRSPPSFLPNTNSPKRSLPLEDSDNDGGRPRKLIRGVSPLKGAAGRRLDQQKRNQPSLQAAQFDSHPPPPIAQSSTLPRDVLFLLSVIPKAETYHATRFRPEEVVRLLRETTIPSSTAQLAQPSTPMGSHPLPPNPPPSHIPQNSPAQARPMPPMPAMSYPPNMSQVQNLSRPPMHQMGSQHAPPHGQPMMMQQYPPASQGQYNSRYPAFPPPSSGVSAFPHHVPASTPNGSEPYGFRPPPFAGHNVEQISNPAYAAPPERAGPQHINHNFVAGFQ